MREKVRDYIEHSLVGGDHPLISQLEGVYLAKDSKNIYELKNQFLRGCLFEGEKELRLEEWMERKFKKDNLNNVLRITKEEWNFFLEHLTNFYLEKYEKIHFPNEKPNYSDY